MATRGTGGLDDTPAHQSEILLKAERPDEVPHERQDFRLAGGRVAKTAQRAEADFAGACGAPPRDALLGRTRRRVRGRRSMRRPSDTASARGAKQNSLTQ